MSQPDRIYISGPMTGLPELNFPAFNAAAAALRAKGYDVANPAEINPDHSATWQECMRADIKALCDCTMLALLPGWENSAGAHLEVHIAHRLGIKVVALAELLPVAVEAVASIYISPNGAREMDDWRHDLPVGRNVLYAVPKAPGGAA